MKFKDNHGKKHKNPIGALEQSIINICRDFSDKLYEDDEYENTNIMRDAYGMEPVRPPKKKK